MEKIIVTLFLGAVGGYCLMLYNNHGNLTLHIIFVMLIAMTFLLGVFAFWNRKNVVRNPIGIIFDTQNTTIIDLSNTSNTAVVDTGLASVIKPTNGSLKDINQAIFEILRSRSSFVNKPRIVFSSRVLLTNTEVESVRNVLELDSALQAIYVEKADPKMMLQRSYDEPYQDNLEQHMDDKL